MPDPKFIVPPEGYFVWTKKLGQRHYAKSGYDNNETLCGHPMLGNNYASKIPIRDQTECEKCAAILSSSCPRCGTRFAPSGSCPKCGTFVPDRTEYEPRILPQQSYSYAELQFRISTSQDIKLLKRIYAEIDTHPDSAHFTEFDKEMLKEEIIHRLQSIEEHESAGQIALKDEDEGLETIIRSQDRYLKQIMESYSVSALEKLIDKIKSSKDITLTDEQKKDLVWRIRDRIKALKPTNEEFAEGSAEYIREQKSLDSYSNPLADIKKDIQKDKNKTPLELAREERLKQFPTVEAFRTAKTNYADFLETDFHLKSHKDKAEEYKPGTIQYNRHMAKYKDRLEEIAKLRKEAAAGKTIYEMQLEDAERQNKEYEAEIEAQQQKLKALTSESYESLLAKAKEFNAIWGDENKPWKDRYKAKHEVMDIISVLKERSIDIIPILNAQLHEIQTKSKNKIREFSLEYIASGSIDESNTSYDINNVTGVKRAALSGSKNIWVVDNKGQEGVILASKYGKDWWQKASQEDIERITVYESSSVYSFRLKVGNEWTFICKGEEIKFRDDTGEFESIYNDHEFLKSRLSKAKRDKASEHIIVHLQEEVKRAKKEFTEYLKAKFASGSIDESNTSYDINNSNELSIVETNLINVGYDLRPDGRGHMVLPNGKGVSPTNHRGIVNHWEVIVDAGYLPSSNIFKLKHSPDAIVAGAINKGWRRWSGEASYEIRDLSKPNVDFINKRLKWHFDNSGLYDANIDVWSEGKYYNFNKSTWDKSNHDILQVVKKIAARSYHPAPAMDLKLMEVQNEYLIKDPASIGCPDTWIVSKGAAFQDDIRGAHHGQVDGTLIAYDLKTSMTRGYIDYSIFEGKLYLNMIEVASPHRRQGYATALLLKLKQLNPGMPVKWGMMTELGCALKNTVDKESPDNPPGVKVYYKGVLGEKHEKYRSGTICDKLKRMDEFRSLIRRVSAESEHDKIERSFDICENDNGKITLSAPRKGHEGCIDYCDTCPPGTKKIADVHTHPTALVNPSVGDYISSINNNQKLFCIAGNDPYKNKVLTVKCYSVPEYLFTEKDAVKKHNKIADLVRKENAICMIRYPEREPSKEERIRIAKGIAATIEKRIPDELLDKTTCVDLSRLSMDDRRRRLARKIASGETQITSSVIEENIKDDCKNWSFGNFEAMLAGMESQEELENIMDCVLASERLTESEIVTLSEIIENKMEE